MLEVLPGASRHDEQASVGQPFCKDNRHIFLFETKQALGPKTDRGDHWAHFGLRIRVQADAVISVLVKVTEYGVVAQASVGPSWNMQLRE